MRSDYNIRQREKTKCRRVMMYVHGGAYFFGSVDEHRYQLQRHARKLQARVFAPRYRLAPQFPFPCGLLDCLAAYLYLLTVHEPSEIVFAGDSAGGGMVLSILCLLRDQGIPLPAGAILISPWVDLTHSFPSLSREDGFDYIPPHGFMQKPSRSWPPPNEDEIQEILKAAGAIKNEGVSVTEPGQNVQAPLSPTTASNFARKLQPPLSLQLDGKELMIKDQIQLYTTNQLIVHPLVSPVLQPSLGGLPPLLIVVGDGELLRDEQIYVAHKAADPQKYKLGDKWRDRYDPHDTILRKYKPTPVQLQVWEDLCHVTPTLSFTRPAKFMYRSVAQFGAWALSRAQKRAIEIMDDDSSSTGSISSDDESDDPKPHALSNGKPTPNGLHAQIGKAGDPIPPFRNSMIREQVDRHGNIFPLPSASELPATKMSPDFVGVVKEGPIRKWLTAKQEWDTKYASTRRKVQKERKENYKAGHRLFFGEGENPPPSALAGRQQDEDATKPSKLKKSWGLGMWSSWGWKHDERTIHKDEEFTKKEEKKEEKEWNKKSWNEKVDSPSIVVEDTPSPNRDRSASRPRSARRKTIAVHDEGQIEGETGAGQDLGGSKLNIPAVAVEPPVQTDGQGAGADPEHLSPMFLPKWKTVTHLRDGSKDVSDTGSTYSRRTFPDNASTKAVFSAPGVTSETIETTDNISKGKNPDSTLDTSRTDGIVPTPRPSTATMARDHVGGYDTPVSRRSVERLQSHQVDVSGDGGSVHSSILTLKTMDRMQPLRSPSSTAIVQAEGVIAPANELTDLAAVGTSGKPSSAHAVVGESDLNKVQPDGTNSQTAVETTDTKLHDNSKTAQSTSERPGLYNRDDSDFVTAMEKL